MERQKQVKQAICQAATGNTIRYDAKVQVAAQQLIDFDLTFGPLYDTQGRVTQIVVSAIDITQRCIAEKNATKNATQIKAILEHNSITFLHLDITGNILESKGGKENLSFPIPDTLINKNLYELLPQSISQSFNSAITKVRETNTPGSFDFIQNIDQHDRWFQSCFLPYLPDEVLVMIKDITEKKAIETKMNSLHTRLFEAQRLAHIGSWEWNLQDNTIWWSEEVYCIFGLNKLNFQPDHETSLRLIHPEDRELVKRVIANTLKISLPFSIEHRIIRSDGEIRHVHEQAALRKNHAGETLLMYGTIQDITEKHTASRMAQEFRDELAHISRLTVMGELAAGLAHELNQPLTAITNYCSSMKSLLDQECKVSELATKIETQSLRSGEIVHRIKSLATKRKQQQNFFNIQDSIRSSIQLINYKIRLLQIDVKLVIENKFTTVFADRIQIEQVLVNLIKNAVEALEETELPRILTITTSESADSMILISVADTGSGIPDAFVNDLFTPFSTNKKEGLGIGLSLSRSLIDASGGKLWYTPNSNGGATFYISLPTTQNEKMKRDRS